MGVAFPRFSLYNTCEIQSWTRKSLGGSSQAIQCNAIWGRKTQTLSTTISENNSRKSFKKQLMAKVSVVYHLGEILKKMAFCLFLTWDGVRSRSNGRGYFAE